MAAKKPAIEKDENVKEPVKKAPEFIKGVVTNGSRLRVRKSPVVNETNVIDTLNPGTEVSIYVDGDEANFYKVKTKSGKIGYCMKEFIEV